MKKREYFVVAGQENRRTIVLLHGLGVSRSWWHPQLDALSDTYRVIAPDLPGHGTRAGGQLDLRQAVDDLSGLIRDQAGGRALVVGISLGGYLAMLHASRHPEQTAGLVLSGCSMNLNGLSGLGMRLSGLFLKFKGAQWLEENQVRSFRKRITADRLEPVLQGGLFMETAVRGFGKVVGQDFHKMLGNYPQPILLLNGERDEPNAGPDERLVRRLPMARLAVLPGAGHLCSLEQPEAYTQAVRDFANRVAWKAGED